MRLQFLLLLLASLLSCKQSEESLFEQALQFEKAEKYVDAVELYSEVLKRNPKNEMSLFNRAICWYQLDSNELALADLSRLIESKPNVGIESRLNPLWDKGNNRWTVFKGEAYFQRGVIKYHLDSLKSAYADFSASAGSSQVSAESYFYMGTIMARYGKKEKACEYFSASLSMGNTKALMYVRNNCP